MFKSKPSKSVLSAIVSTLFYSVRGIASDTFRRIYHLKTIAGSTFRSDRVWQGVILFILAVLMITALEAFVLKPIPASATTSSTINFQARLQSSNGSIAPDGNYNVEFKLYDILSSSGSSQGSCSGDVHCLWVETRVSTDQVHVVNGYLTVNLGSVNPFGTINWNQQLWLTMNIGGTGSPSWDGEMSPRIQLTAVPYALQAGELGNGSNKATLDGSGNLTLQQASIFSTSTGNLTVQAASALALQTAAGGTSSAITIQSGNASSGASGNITIDNGTFTSGTPTISIGTSNANTINIANNAVAHTIAIGSGAAIQGITVGSTNSTSTLLLQGGNGAAAISVQTGSGGTILIGTTAQPGTITIGDSATTNTGNTQTVNLGNLNVAGTTDVNIGSTTNATAGTTTITGKSAVNITGYGSSTWQTSGAALAINGGTTLTLQSATSSTISLDSGTTGDVNVATGANSKNIQIGATNSAITDTIGIGNNTNASAITTLTIGSLKSTSSTAIQGGSNGISLDSGTGNITVGTSANNKTISIGATGSTANTTTVHIGDSTGAAQTITIGSTNGSSGLTLQGGTNNINLLTNSSSASVIVKTNTNSATGFVVQDTSSNQIFGVDTSGAQVLFGKSGTYDGKLLFYSGTTSNTNTITVKSGNTSASYTITLPTAIGSAGQCLSVSSVVSTTEALGYSSCSGSGGGTMTINLIPEFVGATFSAYDALGSSSGTNIGFMTSDHYRSSGVKHNYYQWTSDQTSAQDYHIITEYQLPSNFTGFSGSWTYNVWAENTGSGYTIEAAVYDDDNTDCYGGLQSVTPTSASTWQAKTLSAPAGSCTFAANDIITIDIKLTAKSPTTNTEKIGEVKFAYTY